MFVTNLARNCQQISHGYGRYDHFENEIQLSGVESNISI